MGLKCAAAAASPDPLPAPAQGVRPLDLSRRLARSRQLEGQQPDPLFQDPYASALAATGPQEQHEATSSGGLSLITAQDIIATKYMDETLMNALAATSVNRINKGDYRQVVLLGDGMDTRPWRLMWPEGTLIFSVAPGECHELAEAVLRQEGARVQRGCLLRRVNADLQAGTSFEAELLRAGFQGDKLSVWVLQGLHGLELGVPQLQSILVDVTNLAAFNSLVLGELPGVSKQQADSLLAEFGLLGAVLPMDLPETSYSRWPAAEAGGADAGSSSVGSGEAGSRQG
eukprot:CAMPEP_0202889950 /NCGR_PEP_ID=MMETSP1392-20130828/486_1 /ASSEMBLY_ACC=CAM_ASM_000868 /TAXON_ID=225041 /ORGANISM="Chlamydomonas chlamydogama, Strain SAG 11-48b" /LENGTH=285 /DNA_ID=CAMNT_0049573403 /DNA_START=205 /DNA_END=1059 /DNA_ORIENTATION=-